jgi:cell wall-associated NlpC family hydrolase
MIMKKGIAMSICLSAAALGMSATDSHAQEVGTITASALNIRSGAGTENPVVAKVYRGQTVTILETQGGWYKVTLSNGTTGWGSADYIRTGTQASAPTQATSTPASGTGTITAGTLNIRSGAGTGYSVVTKAYSGQTVTLLESQSGWYKVKLSNGTIGWASASYVSKGSVAPQESVSEAPSRGTDRSAVVNLAYAQMGKSYRWGAEGPTSFDCSGFTTYVYKNAEGKSIPRTSVAQSGYGASVSRSQLQPGDLVFFDTDKDGDINHVGIYVGGGQFVHASSGAGKVTKSDLNGWYSDKFRGAKRP